MFPVKTKILLVDDMPAVRTWEKKQLLKLGFKDIFEAENGEAALSILDEQSKKNEPIELILCDWQMPGLDGLGLLERINASDSLKGVPMVMISAETDAPKVLKAMKMGVTDYITKPFVFEVLKRKLELVWENITGEEGGNEDEKGSNN